MEPSIKWAGNPNIHVAVKAFGLKATVQVIGLFYDQYKHYNVILVMLYVTSPKLALHYVSA